MDIKGIEQLIRQIKSVISCKIVVDDDDNIREIHILSDTSRSPKQLSRDIQSSLISMYGLNIDHKKISIAQIDDRSIGDKSFRLKVKSIEYSTNGTKANGKVTLEKNDEIFEGEYSGVNSKNNSQRIVANATLKAVEKFLEIDYSLLFEDIKEIQLAGKDAIVIAIAFISEYGEQIFSGCSFVNSDKREAVVKATLDAINRRVMKYHNDN